jgi:hypothetical protein
MQLAGRMEREGWRQDTAVNLVVILFVINAIGGVVAPSIYCSYRTRLVEENEHALIPNGKHFATTSAVHPWPREGGEVMNISRAVRACCGILAVGVCGFGVVRAQKKAHVDRPIIEARAEDVSKIEGIVTASYETISGGVGVPRQWGRDRTLFDPNSRSVAVGVNPKTKAVTTHGSTEQEFADESDASLVKDGFTERELKHVIKRFGNVATVLSSYEGTVASGKVITRGVNIFQLYFDGKRWWILSMVWDEERPDNPIPAELQ